MSLHFCPQLCRIITQCPNTPIKWKIQFIQQFWLDMDLSGFASHLCLYAEKPRDSAEPKSQCPVSEIPCLSCPGPGLHLWLTVSSGRHGAQGSESHFCLNSRQGEFWNICSSRSGSTRSCHFRCL